MSEIGDLAKLLSQSAETNARHRIIEEAVNIRRRGDIDGLPFYLQRVNVDTPLPIKEWPLEFRALHFFSGLMLQLPRKGSELDKCLSVSAEYVEMLERSPDKVQALLRLHEHFVAFSGREETFSLENIFLVDGARMDELASTSPEPPYDVFVNDVKIWRRPAYLRDEAILHELTHRFRNKRNLCNTKYRAVEEGIVTLVSKSANSELHSNNDDAEFKNGYEFEAAVMYNLLKDYSINSILWMNETAIERTIGAPVSLLNHDMETTLSLYRAARRIGSIMGKDWGNSIIEAFKKRWKLDMEINIAWIA